VKILLLWPKRSSMSAIWLRNCGGVITRSASMASDRRAISFRGKSAAKGITAAAMMMMMQRRRVRVNKLASTPLLFLKKRDQACPFDSGGLMFRFLAAFAFDRIASGGPAEDNLECAAQLGNATPF
jgi:hypothetical protein